MYSKEVLNVEAEILEKRNIEENFFPELFLSTYDFRHEQ